MISLKEFKDYYKRLDEMIAESTKADLAECARLLALNVAHYRAKYGELPIAEHQALLEADDIGLPRLRAGRGAAALARGD